ncbi:hypothetical protein [Streptomyces sp. NBRC 109706]|uniref:hypothetical protein n=1 Tax=Streptomyces sp. NBRC 109706 TaxID=1550035 RepID=UPI00078291AF|nr:hypothetical protein [Streptomyces sp. NBRC 109706]
MTDAPLATVTVADWDAAEVYLAEHTSDATYTLTELTAAHDADLHEIRLDPETRTIWWAYDNGPVRGKGWTVDHLTPAAAAEQAEPIIDTTQDRMGDPEGYAGQIHRLDDDQALLDEYTEILRLTLPADPQAARAEIRTRRALADALWQRADAELVRSLAGSDRGGKAAAARTLGITRMQVTRLISDDDRRRDALTQAVREAEADYPDR